MITLDVLQSFITDYSFIGIFFIIIVESGLVVGAFLPGDSFLFLTGILAAKGILEINVLLWTVVTAAFLGNELGYYLGKRYGWQAISFFSKKYADSSHHEKAHAFYARWGVYAVILARFVPVMRSLIPTVAGMAEMQRSRFSIANAVGALAWGCTVPMVGFLAGDHMSTHSIVLVPLIGFLAVGIVLPIATSMWHTWRKRTVSPR